MSENDSQAAYGIFGHAVSNNELEIPSNYRQLKQKEKEQKGNKDRNV